jgi:hypothetical protein
MIITYELEIHLIKLKFKNETLEDFEQLDTN